MNERERFLATARFGPVDRAFLLRPWPWQSTTERWRREGLPADVSLAAYFRTDREHTVPLAIQGKYGPHLHPPLEREVLSETEEQCVVRDEEGNVVRLFKDHPERSMPEWIEYPMEGRDDWEQVIKPRLDPAVPGRHPQGEGWEHFVTEAGKRDYPLGIWCGSFYGWCRSFLGVEQLSLTFYDEPRLVHEMAEHFAEFAIQLVSPILDQIPLDFAFIWEDMGAKSGPLCSPKTYREFFLAPLKQVTAMLHGHGIDIILLDSDGNNDELVPLWLEAGVNGLRPFEVAAGCDAVATRRQHGNDLIIQGAIDKRALARSIDDIDREILSKVPWLCLQGGYFPQVDHLVPPDVPFENYRHYSHLLREVTEDPERYLSEARTRGFWEG